MSVTDQELTPNQCDINQMELIKLIVSSIQKGDIVVGNSARLQNLTIDDIIKIAQDNIEMPDIGSQVIHNPDGTTTNIIDYTRTFNHYKSIAIKKIIIPVDEVQDVGEKLRVVVPNDLNEAEQIISVHLENPWDVEINDSEGISPSKTDGIFVSDWVYWLDSSKSYPEHQVDFYKDKYDYANKAVVVTYMYDKSWISPSSPDPVAPIPLPPGSVVVKATKATEPIAFNYGQNTTVSEINTDTVNVIHDSNKIINLSKSMFPLDGVIHTRNEELNLEGMLLDLVSKPDDFKQIRILSLNKGEPIPSNGNGTQFNKGFNHYVVEYRVLSRIIDAVKGDVINFPELANVIYNPNKNIQLKKVEGIKLHENLNVYHYNSRKIVSSMGFNIISIPKSIMTIYSKNYIIGQEGVQRTNLEFLSGKILKNYLDGTYDGTLNLARYIDTVINDSQNAMVISVEYRKNKIIEQKDINPFVLPDLLMNIPNKNYIIGQTSYNRIIHSQLVKVLFNSNRIINQLNINKIDWVYKIKLLYKGNKIISTNKTDFPNILRERVNVLYNTNRIILPQKSQEPINFFTEPQTTIVKGFEKEFNSTEVSIFPKPYRIVEQIGYIPALFKMSGVNPIIIRDDKNARIVSSLNKKDYVPLFNSEQLVKEKPYVFTADENQRVFPIKNTGLITVHREGFLLSPGDFTHNEEYVILNSPCRQGDTVVITTKVKFSYSEAITREELLNELVDSRTETPILTYKASVYEGEAINIKVNNYSPHNIYDVKIRYHGKSNTTPNWTQMGDTITINAPEIDTYISKTVQISVSSIEPNKLASKIEVANVEVKNTFDEKNSSASTILLGETSQQLLGEALIKYPFMDKINQERSMNFEVLTNPDNIDDVTLVIENGEVESKLINGANGGEVFRGRGLYPSMGLRDTNDISVLPLKNEINSTQFPYTSVLTSDTIIKEAHEKGNLYFILNKDTLIPGREPLMSAEYQNSRELVGDIVTFPDPNGVIIEHTDKLINRVIKRLLILDMELLIDFDTETRVNLPKDNEDYSIPLPVEKFEVKFHEGMPILEMIINTPEITSKINDTFNLDSSYRLKTSRGEFDLGFNAIDGNKIFSGLKTNISNNDPVLPNNLFVTKKIPENPLAYTAYLHGRNSDWTPNNKLFRWMLTGNNSTILPLSDNLTGVKETKDVCILKTHLVNESDSETGLDLLHTADIVKYGGLETHINGDAEEHDYITNKIIVDEVLESGKLNPGDTHYDKSLAGILTRVRPKEFNYPNFWDIVFKPSTTKFKDKEIEKIFKYITLGDTPEDNSNFDNINWGFVKLDRYNGDIINIPGTDTSLLLGGITYGTTLEEIDSYSVSDDVIDNYKNEPFYVELLNFYNKKKVYDNPATTEIDGFYNTDHILSLDTGFDSITKEPYIIFNWGRNRHVPDDVQNPYRTKVFKHKLSRKPVINKSIYLINSFDMDTNIASKDHSKFTESSNVSIKLGCNGWSDLWTNPNDVNDIKVLPNENNLEFIDVVYDDNSLYMLIWNNTINKLELQKLEWGTITTPTLTKIMDISDVGTERKLWRLVPNNISTPDGEVYVVKASKLNPDTTDGIYSVKYSLANGYHLEQKSNTTIPNSDGLAIWGLNEIGNYDAKMVYIEASSGDHQLISQTGVKLGITTILNKVEGELTDPEWQNFLEDIILLDSGASNLPKEIKILPNHKELKPRRIIQDNNIYTNDGLQVQFWKMSSEDGRQKEDFQFRISSRWRLNIDSLRFSLNNETFIN